MNAEQILRAAPVMPVMVIERIEDALPLAEALLRGGLPVLEITLRTPVALAAIRMIAERLPEAIVGAGTVLDPAQFDAAAAAGARFAIAPGASDALYTHTASNPFSVPFIPGIATASEAMRGRDAGHRHFKFFPAEGNGGVAALKSLSGPLHDVFFCPTGGIDAAKACAYLALPNVLTVGGSWMLPNDAIRAGDWARIERLAREAAALRG